MCAERDGEAAADRNFVRNQGGGDLVHSKSAVFLRHVYFHQAKFACFSKKAACHVEILRFDSSDLRLNLLLCKIHCRALDLPLYIGQIFQRKNVLRANILD